MIKVNFRQPRIKRWRKWRNDCKRALTALKDKGPPYTIDENLYKACRDLLFSAYANKCAYCEGPLDAQSRALVEHFRPKGGVHDLENKVVLIGPKKPHPGYWWLAYDPSNLLPTCSMCNVYTRRFGGKGERFPLPTNGFRATQPGEERKEKPLLIHPARQDPSAYFDIDEKGFLKAHKPGDTRVEACIEVFGLNREKLVEARNLAMMDATLYIHQTRRKTLAKAIKERVDQQLAGRLPYSLVWRKVREQMSQNRRRRPTRKRA